jgi:Chitobiase/beta-hexosaminidase C-terminal domain
MKRLTIALLVLSPALVAAACSSDDDKAASSTRTRSDSGELADAATAPDSSVQVDPTAIARADAGASSDAAGRHSDSAHADDAGAPPREPSKGSDKPAPGGMKPADEGRTTPSGPVTCPEGAPRVVDRVRLLPGTGQAGQLVGAKIQGSNVSPTTEYVDLATLGEVPDDGTPLELMFGNTQLYRYVRYYAAPESQGGVAELEFYSGMTRVPGEAFGTASWDEYHAFNLAFDGDPTTYFAPNSDGGFAGIDIARGFVTRPVRFEPGATTSENPIEVRLSSETADATIRYTIDGRDPTASSALTYDNTPIRIVTGRTTIRAVAVSPCRFASSTTSATYSIGQAPVSGGLKTYHVGNSLTDMINPWLEPIAESTGVDHTYARWTIPGAPIKWMEEHEGQGFEDPPGAANYDDFVRMNAPIDHLSLQPYSDPDFTTQGGAAARLLNRALQFNPQIQFWIYATWPGRSSWTRDAMSNGGGTLYPDWQVAMEPMTWEDAARNQALYYEAFRDYVDSRVEGKRILIIPGGLALVELKRQIEAGLVPGMTNFFSVAFADEQHLKKAGQYLVSLVFYACLYRQSPEARVTYADTDLTEEQAHIFQRIAWDVSVSYPGSGIAQ